MRYFIFVLISIAILGGSYFAWEKYENQAIIANKDLMLCNLYLSYEEIHIETQNSDAIKRTNDNILNLISESKMFIRYIDENQKYFEDEYSTLKDYAIILTLNKIFFFSTVLFKESRINVEVISMMEISCIATLVTDRRYNQYYRKIPDKFDCFNVSAHGWPVMETLENLRMKFHYNYGSINRDIGITLTIASTSKYYLEVVLPVTKELEQRCFSNTQ